MIIPEQNIISLSDNIPSFPPVEGFISQRMKNMFSNIDEAHGGIDIVAKEGTPISSAASGVIVFSGWTYEMGNLIIIYHGGGYICLLYTSPSPRDLSTSRMPSSA